MGKMERIIAGDTSREWQLGYVISAPGVSPVELADLDGNFTCRCVVAGTLIDRAVTAKTNDNKRFRVWLTAEESLTLSGTVTFGMQISNGALTPPLVIEHQVKLYITPGVVPNS